MEKKVTIREVAKLAGVSISSVSRYLNDPTSIRPVAAYNIKRAIRELEFEPSAAAQSLKRGQSRMIGVIVPHMRVFFEVVSSVITDYFYERGYMTVVCLSDGEEEKERSFVEGMLRQQAAGIVIAPSGRNTDFLRGVAEKKSNLVAIDRAEEIGCPVVLENHRENAYRLVKHVLAAGPCDRLFFLHGWENSFSTKMCQAGSRRAMEEAGFAKERVCEYFTHSSQPGVAAALRQFMGSLAPAERPAIVAYGTDMLEYAVMGLHQQYPEWAGRVRLAGFALPGTREKLGIPCSLVIKNPQRVGAAAAELMYRRLQGQSVPQDVVEIPVEYSF
ncbi:MAG: LacI family DNA-binding transcriptional regulator [Clostridia bacterium]|nr:LacI family DNA-binding transcriptional regulator [Clostridia bacterium]